MINKYRAEQIVCINCTISNGTEIDLRMLVDFTVYPGAQATLIDPPEYPMAEANQIQFFEIKDGKDSAEPVALPEWMIERFTGGEDFQEWMLAEAAEQHEAAADEHADQRREMMLEERL
jgi:hypothetical protein